MPSGLSTASMAATATSSEMSPCPIYYCPPPNTIATICGAALAKPMPKAMQPASTTANRTRISSVVRFTRLAPEPMSCGARFTWSRAENVRAQLMPADAGQALNEQHLVAGHLLPLRYCARADVQG